jgi:hypothetical protein
VPKARLSVFEGIGVFLLEPERILTQIGRPDKNWAGAFGLRKSGTFKRRAPGSARIPDQGRTLRNGFRAHVIVPGCIQDRPFPAGSNEAKAKGAIALNDIGTVLVIESKDLG